MKNISINRIELLGTVGTSRIIEVNGKKVITFSLYIEKIYNSMDKTSVCECTRHIAVAWEGPTIDKDVFTMQKGDRIHLVGTIRNSRYTAADGSEKVFTEILATELEHNPKEDEFQFIEGWKFVYDEEIAEKENTSFIGLISNGKTFLFYKTEARKQQNDKMYIYASMANLVQDEPEVSFDWTKQNEEILIKALNSLKKDDQDRFCGEYSILQEVKFKN